MEFNSTLLREKFIIRDVTLPDDDDAVIALSNRMVVPLATLSGQERETFVVRAQNMHTCVRMAAMIVKEFHERGSIMKRLRPYYWQDDWKEVTKGYERDWNPKIWGVVYHNGRVVFEDGVRHPFLDVIEQCDVKNKGEYSSSTIEYAQNAFRQAGKNVTIDYDSNVALVVSCKPEEAKCGVIVRSANKTTTFNFSAKPRTPQVPVKASQSLTVSAAFLEGVQLAFQVGMYNKKTSYGLIDKTTDDAKKGQRSVERVGALNRAISQYENLYNVHYRPERPSFSKAIEEAEAAAQDILAPQIQAMLEKGDLNPDEWIE